MKKIIFYIFLFSTLCYSDTLGFKVEEIENNSMFAKMHLKKDDTITNINNKKIHNLNDIMNFMSDFKNIKSISVIRNGLKKEIYL